MIAIIGLFVGIIFGIVFDINIPEKFSPYIAVLILSCLDSVFGAYRASISKKFRTDIFLTGFLGNLIIALVLTYLGDKLGVPIYIVAIIVLGSRIFKNFSTIRRLLLYNFKNIKKR